LTCTTCLTWTCILPHNIFYNKVIPRGGSKSETFALIYASTIQPKAQACTYNSLLSLKLEIFPISAISAYQLAMAIDSYIAVSKILIIVFFTITLHSKYLLLESYFFKRYLTLPFLFKPIPKFGVILRNL
jgi:hypothetical protein